MWVGLIFFMLIPTSQFRAGYIPKGCEHVRPGFEFTRYSIPLSQGSMTPSGEDGIYEVGNPLFSRLFNKILHGFFGIGRYPDIAQNTFGIFYVIRIGRGQPK